MLIITKYYDNLYYRLNKKQGLSLQAPRSCCAEVIDPLSLSIVNYYSGRLTSQEASTLNIIQSIASNRCYYHAILLSPRVVYSTTCLCSQMRNKLQIPNQCQQQNIVDKRIQMLIIINSLLKSNEKNDYTLVLNTEHKLQASIFI